ncbi:hypothetical protein OKW38_000394 [Paraburkholderia sp. MM5496-R1]
MRFPSSTVSISVVNGFLCGADRAAVARLAEPSGIPHELLRKAAARVTEEQFSTLYTELDDEMPGIFSRPLRSGTRKFLCLGLLDAPRLEVALHRFRQFLHLILDDFRLESTRDGPHATIEFAATSNGPPVSGLARELMLELVHGVASWLIRQKILIVEATFEYPRPSRSSDLLYLFPGPIRFGRERTGREPTSTQSPSFSMKFLVFTAKSPLQAGRPA